MTTKTATKTKEETRCDPPGFYEVILLNDDFTTMDFVVDILIDVFQKPPQVAQELMWNIHHSGSAVCGIYALEIAEMRVKQVEKRARAANFPLLCILKPH